MPGHGEKLTRKQEQAIAALLAEPTIDAAAEKAGVGLSTLKNWLKLPAFLAAYRAARRQIVEGALGQLQQATGQAVEALKRNLTCDQPGQQIRAAVAILDHAVKAVEVLDLADQLADLKRQVEELKHGNRDDAQGVGPSEGGGGPPPADGEADHAAIAGGPGPDPERGGNAPGPLASELAPFQGETDAPPLFSASG